MRFLIIRFSSLGDIIQTTALVHTLKSLYPTSTVIYVTKPEFEELLKNQPYIDEIYSLKSNIKDLADNIKNVDCILDLHKNPKSIMLSKLIKSKCIKRVKKHTIYRRALVYKIHHPLIQRKTQDNIEDQLKLLNIKNDSSIKPRLFSEVRKKDNVVGIAVGARWETKMWPKEYFKALIKLILEKTDKDVYLFGSKSEKPIADFIIDGFGDRVKSFVGELSILETIQKMALCNVFISNDSGLMHAAVALDIPLVAIFGPTVKGFGFFPRGNSVVLEKELSCRPCSLHGSSTCPTGRFDCMLNILPDEVFETILKIENDKKNHKEGQNPHKIMDR
ncbi:glycosyltransferase family 9 protein [Hippea maritima]|uniref:Glycosyl transferase family 9 n=1 Tax=Hippea maritima (strain ATCC 700847 / DSM 10411 / MH2) TaxID=760142 RepID=F2LVG7_HIPMA|nr:glycosyltransferase family 9 protein [Hippea maritima]AEA33751.1 glycosyl transferase family 9 [Hippea maritima DSM 10411]